MNALWLRLTIATALLVAVAVIRAMDVEGFFIHTA